MRKFLVGPVALAAVAAPLAFATSAKPLTPATAQFIVNGDFSTSGVNGALLTPATTDFELATPGLFGKWGTEGQGTMYDPGRYVIGNHPPAVHELWADFGRRQRPDADRQRVPDQEPEGVVADDEPGALASPGSMITFDFTANATNILPPENVRCSGCEHLGHDQRRVHRLAGPDRRQPRQPRRVRRDRPLG